MRGASSLASQPAWPGFGGAAAPNGLQDDEHARSPTALQEPRGEEARGRLGEEARAARGGIAALLAGRQAGRSGALGRLLLKMAEKLAPPGELFLRKGRESVSSLDMDRLAPGEAAGEESSDSEGEQDGSSHKLIRKVSTSGQMRTKSCVITLAGPH
uniref:Uncharacterized protein n=1 Tax=Sphaerodactylus townsendi TaxID=933632 RepID=A0ACB8FYM7_9SAUR